MTDVDTLREFVRESNAIEGIYAVLGEPLYDDHLSVAGMIDEYAGRIFSLSLLHAQVMDSQPSSQPGRYRKVDVSVGGHRKMPWRDVPAAMVALLKRADDGDTGALDNSGGCWALHNEFEHIHPFRDGNGRTGRLWMNALRLAVGLPWLIVYERDRQAYYQRIMDWEREHDPR